MNGSSQDGVMKILEEDGVCGTQGGQPKESAWRTGALRGSRRAVWEAGLGEWGQNVRGERGRPAGHSPCCCGKFLAKDARKEELILVHSSRYSDREVMVAAIEAASHVTPMDRWHGFTSIIPASEKLKWA